MSEYAALRRLSWHPFRGGPSGSLLEFPQAQLCQRDSSIRSSFPSQDACWETCHYGECREAHLLT